MTHKDVLSKEYICYSEGFNRGYKAGWDDNEETRIPIGLYPEESPVREAYELWKAEVEHELDVMARKMWQGMILAFICGCLVTYCLRSLIP